MQIVGADPNARPVSQERQPGIVNYFIGNDPSQWHANIPTFGRVEYQDVYPGVDLAYYGNNGQVEYDFIVSPGADPNQIALDFAGADGIEINAQGDLVVHAAAGDLVQQMPFTYQNVGQTRKEVPSRYVLDGTQVSFEVGAYDVSQPLIIDPLVLGYSTYLGGSESDYGFGMAVDNGANVYVAGMTGSTNFPATPGGFDTTPNICDECVDFLDTFVAKLSADGKSLFYSTFLGGLKYDAGYDIAVDGSGNAYVTGETNSSDFPTTPGAFDTTYNGNDAFVTKLRADGAGLLYSTFLGGSTGDEYVPSISLDSGDSAYVAGYTASADFPVTQGAFDTTYNGIVDAYVTKLRPDGTGLLFSTFLGGATNDFASDIAVDGSGNAYVIGETNSANFPTTPSAFDTTYNGNNDAFVARLRADGAGLLYSTFLGGSDGIDRGLDIAVDGGGNAYAVGNAGSMDFPTTPGAFDTSPNANGDAFVAKLNPAGTALAYSTFLGGSSYEWGNAIVVDGRGNAYLTGLTHSSDFPTTPGAFDTSHIGSAAFVTKLNAAGSSLAYSTFLDSASGQGLAVDGGTNVYVAGTAGSNFPTTPGAFDTSPNGGGDAFVTKFCNRACRVPVKATQVVPQDQMP